jgi:hypothetical protein
VVIAVYGRIVNAGDCSTAGRAVPVVARLASDLGARAVRDAAGGSPPVYHQQHLPELPATAWQPYDSSWMATDKGWHQGFNGPNGSTLSLSAQPTAGSPDFGSAVTTVRLGARQGTVTGGGQGLWRVSWQVTT